MKGYTPKSIKFETANTSPTISLELGMVEKCDKCKKIECECLNHKQK